VLPAFRRQGIGTALMDALERTIAERSAVAGIGVGLYADHGAAQRMYILRGYVPDGRGAFCMSRPLHPGKTVPVDDSLVLFMTKQLANGGTQRLQNRPRHLPQNLHLSSALLPRGISHHADHR
jgi:hypothetical protein